MYLSSVPLSVLCGKKKQLNQRGAEKNKVIRRYCFQLLRALNNETEILPIILLPNRYT